MNWKQHIIEAATLILAAVICALTANAFASREKKLAVAPSESFAAPPPSAMATSSQPPVATTTTAAPIPTATVVPATTTTAKPSSTATATTTTAAPPKPVVAAPPAKSASDFKPHPEKAYVEVAYDDVHALHSAGVLFLDARRTSVYEQGHIAGARSYSVWESDIDEKVNKLFAERGDPREQEKPIVIYCSGGDCEDSHMLAQKLWGIQFNNVYVYKDGFPDWQKRGGSVRTGANP
jgi:rhodanese-related sulfurtransferase